MCDKPFALDAAAAQATVERARAAGRLLSPYQNRRWDSDLLTLRRVLADGELGDVVRFESAFERWEPTDPPAAGGGLLRDFGAHLVDQALHLFGPVAAVGAQSRGGDGAELEFRLQLTHRDGVRSELSGSWKQPVPGPRFRLTARRGPSSWTRRWTSRRNSSSPAGRPGDGAAAGERTAEPLGCAGRRRRSGATGAERAGPLARLLHGVRGGRAR